jgi:hypothetical protein
MTQDGFVRESLEKPVRFETRILSEKWWGFWVARWAFERRR